MSQFTKGDIINKAELEAIRDKYRQRRYDECIREVKDLLILFSKYLINLSQCFLSIICL